MHRLLKAIAAGSVAMGMLTLALLAPTERLQAAPPDKKMKDGPPPPPKAGPKGSPKGPHDLKKTYDDLLDVSAQMRAGGKRYEEARPALDAARRLYRDAVRAFDGDDSRMARELALAAHEATRGLMHFCKANRPIDPDLPRPPTGPEEADASRPARDELERAKDRHTEAEEGGPVGREFLAAAKRVIAEALRAYDDKEFDRAAELARCAAAWTHVGEHLSRAGGPDTPSPNPKRLDRKAPPPPPAE